MIPWLMIAVGGTMILSGVKETNPVALIKAILTGEPMPGGTSTDTTGTNGTAPVNSITGDPVVQTTRGTSDRSIAGQGLTSTTRGTSDRSIAGQRDIRQGTSDRSIEQSGQNAASAGWTSGGGGKF